MRLETLTSSDFDIFSFNLISSVFLYRFYMKFQKVSDFEHFMS